MPSMTKRVNIRTTIPVRNINPPISGTYSNIIMSTGDILKCLCKRAIVEEILPDGTIVRLNMRNYFTDNGAGLDAAAVVAKEPKPHKTSKKEKLAKTEKAPEVPVVLENNEVQVVETTLDDNNTSGAADAAVALEPSTSEAENISEYTSISTLDYSKPDTETVTATNTDGELFNTSDDTCVKESISATTSSNRTPPKKKNNNRR